MAKLANLPINSEQEDKYSEQLSEILDYIDHLNTAQTEDVSPIFNVSEKVNSFAEDQIKDGLSQEEALKNSPNFKNGYFVTKGVFEDE